MEKFYALSTDFVILRIMLICSKTCTFSKGDFSTRQMVLQQDDILLGLFGLNIGIRTTFDHVVKVLYTNFNLHLELGFWYF